jgi:hypothetical protein
LVAQLLLSRILIDGSILTAIVASILVLMLYFKPRLALSDYPEDVKAIVPPRTQQELRLGILISLPVLLISVAIPLYSAWLVKQQNADVITYWMAFATIFGEYFLLAMFDLIVLDILMFYTWTPRFVVIPGSEGLPGYKDFRPHMKAQLTKGNALLAIVSAILALIPTFLY